LFAQPLSGKREKGRNILLFFFEEEEEEEEERNRG